MGAQSLRRNERLSSRDRFSISEARLVGARVTGMIGLGAYNWWIAAPFVAWDVAQPRRVLQRPLGRRPAACGDAASVDTAAGLLLLAALLLRGPSDGLTKRPEWPWLVTFAMVAAIGGMFPYACQPGYDAACRRLQFSFELPLHHYIHMLSGILEFATASIAILARPTIRS